MLYQLYIGADNDTKQLKKSVIEFIASRYFNGFTLIEAQGFWKGEGEPSAILEVETKDRDRVLALAIELKNKLNQQAIGMRELPSLQFIGMTIK